MVDQITADELADRIDAGDASTIGDTRPADSFESWHLPSAVNVPYDLRGGLGDEQFRRVEDVPAKHSTYEAAVAIDSCRESPRAESEVTERAVGLNDCAA